MSIRSIFFALTGILVLGPALALSAGAQVADSTLGEAAVLELDPVIVTASKVATSLSSSTVGVSVLDAKTLRALPSRGTASLLGYIPGMLFLDFDGLGYAPQAVTRGFYGGGEAEYVVVLVDGKPVNNLENGLVNWEQIATGPGTVVEVLRGGASSLYGDAAIGAVINIRTDPANSNHTRFSASTGSLGIRNVSGSVARKRYSGLAEFNSSAGFRDHSRRLSGTLRGSYQLINGSNRSLGLTASLNVRDYETPGPLHSTDNTRDTSESLPFFQFDQADEMTLRTSLDGSWDSRAGRWGASITSELRQHDLVRTIPLSADFADTQERQIDAVGLRTSIQVSDLSLPLPMENEITLGMDGYIGTLGTRYYQIATGGLDDTYLGATGSRGPLLSDGTAKRSSFAGYGFLTLNPSPSFNLSVGARVDAIRDVFDEIAGLSDGLPSSSRTAFSPKIGMNYRYASSASQVGNVYASASRSFKAPTLDQLYDLRAFPVPFPPFSIQIANAELVPQEGTSLEMGFYHRLRTENGLFWKISGSAYTIDMTNEIDFSFETFSNVNIGESRHRGVETSLTVEKGGIGSAFLNYTLQHVTLLKGENEGSRVKAIPLHAFGAGIVAEMAAVTSSLVLRGVRDIYVDDANTIPLPNYATLDARISYTRKDLSLTLDVHNAFDRDYSSTAFQDPAGSDVLFIFPAALRTVTLGIELSL